jgi:DNA gyrase subunit B
MAEKGEYSAKDIMVLSGPQGVRKRPAMYIGSTGSKGFFHLLYEILSNSIDEAQAGYAHQIKITLTKEEEVDAAEVQDDGRGIPVDIIEKEGKPALEVIMTSLHAGGKFENKAYKVSGGLHGVGLTVVNALSEYTVVTVRRDGKIYQQRFSRGGVLTPLEIIGETKTEDTGTNIRFKPDAMIFSAKSFDTIELNEMLKEISFLCPGIKITLVDKRDAEGKTTVFVSERGIHDFIEFLKGKAAPITKPLVISGQADSIKVDMGIQYVESYSENLLSFVNMIKTPEGGTHVVGLHTALTRAITNYIQKNYKKSKSPSIEGEDTREGLVAIIALYMQNPEFEGQTKEKLGNPTVKSLIDSMVYAKLSAYLEENPSEAGKILSKVFGSAQARESAKKARDLVRKKSLFEGSVLPGKLADCTEDDPEKSEIFIVEGDSAGGCFAGDVKVALADGRNISFKELVDEDNMGRQNFCYTIKDDGTIGIQKITNPRLTKRNTEVIKITLDNAQEIICTPNHEFMLRNGNYKTAKDLKKEDSLMPLHKRVSKIGGRITIDGYEMVWDQNKTWIFTHMLADEYNLENGVYSKEQGDTRHHTDFNKLNNNPPNIVRIPKEDHLILHTQNLHKTLHSQAVKEKAVLAHKNPRYKDKVRAWSNRPAIKKTLSANAKRQWENKKYKEYMKQRFLDFYNSNEDYRNKNNALLYQKQEEYWSNIENRKKASERTKRFFEENPHIKEQFSKLAKEEWKDGKLLVWRSQKTKEQWTPEFRRKRKEAYNKTYYNRTIDLMKKVIEGHGDLKQFDPIRINNKDKTILSSREFCSRFFNNDKRRMLEAINNSNHKIKHVEPLSQRVDVYDIEVPNTHNFALASGVFVHNSSKQGRDRKYQAILPLKGKILNVEKASEDKIFNNAEIHTMVTAFGVGIKEQFKPENLRYNKIILLADADVDGSHIRTLLLTFFYRYMKALIERGKIYIAQPPLYMVSKGRETKYAYSDKQMSELTKSMGEKVTVQRYKGLGEMNSGTLWETTMNPENRVLKRVTIKDAQIAEAIFTVLMGLDVEPRKKFLEEHSHEVSFLDI